LRESDKARDELPADDVCGDDWSEGLHAEEWSLSVQVVWICLQRQQLRDDEAASPLCPENLRQLP